MSLSRMLLGVALLFCAVATAQTTGATFGRVISLAGTPSDIVLDERRQQLYLVRQNANRVDVYDWVNDRILTGIPVGSGPVAASLSMDGDWLYVSNNGSSSLSVVDLRTYFVTSTVSLAAKPEGVEAGADGRVLITTEGTGTTDSVRSLLIFDRSQSQSQQITEVAFPPPPPTPSTLPAAAQTRPITTFRGKLQRTPDGNFIIGLSTINNNASTVLFVYEVASGSILRSRTVTGQSTTLSISPDGARFMAGAALYDTATLAVVAQQSIANVPFPLSATGTASFNLLQNLGGSSFSPDGTTLYSAFNVAPFSQPAARVQASTLLISNPRNLGVRLGIKIPESIVARMVITSSGSDAWGLSESGLIHLPLSTLYDYPILQPESTTVFLSVDSCNRSIATGSLRIVNAGSGTLTFSVPDTTAALVAQATSGVAPSTVQFTLEPGRTSVTRQYGTNLYSGGATNSGTALLVNLTSPDAINVPNTIRVFMNVRQQDQRGVVFPVATSTTATEGLQDIIVDEERNRIYVTNAGYNRIEVFDRTTQRFLTPIETGQLPHQMALAGDGRTLYVANAGGESIDIIDLDAGQISGSVAFPPYPRTGSTTPVTPQAIAMSTFGLQVVMSNGSQWKVVGDQLTLRESEAVVPVQIPVTTQTGVPRMAARQNGQSLITLAGNGTAYLYDGLSDAYSVSNRPYSTQTNATGFFGPLSAAPDGSFYLMNGFILNSGLTPIGGSESPSATQSGPMASPRNVAAVAAISSDSFVRITTPVKATLTSTPTSDSRPTLELVNLKENSVNVVGAIAENPSQTLLGNARINAAPRMIAVDSTNTAYAITLSGLTVIPLTPSGSSRPQLTGGNSAIINTTDGTTTLRPGSFFRVTGQNLAAQANSGDVPVPTLLGGSCVTFSDTPAPLLQSSSGEILGQVPDTLLPGTYVLQVRSLATGQQSSPLVVTIARPQ